MTWFRVDDGFSDHPKVHKLQESKHWKGALALWTLAGSWCAKHETDGFVASHTVRRLEGTTQEAAALVDAGLWKAVEGGYQFHNWQERNPLKSELEAKREQTKKRVSDWRAKRSGNAVTAEYENEPVTLPPTLPIPTLPDPIQENTPVGPQGGDAGEPKAKRKPRQKPEAVAALESAVDELCKPCPPVLGAKVKAGATKRVADLVANGTCQTPTEAATRLVEAWKEHGTGNVWKLLDVDPVAPPRALPANANGRLPRTRGTTHLDFANEPTMEEQLRGWANG